jgi:hypothetical protein
MRGKPRMDLKFTSGQLEVIGDANLKHLKNGETMISKRAIVVF